MYGEGKSEKLVGEAIKGYDRSKLFLISNSIPIMQRQNQNGRVWKLVWKRLGTDYLDLYLLHWRGNHRLSDTIRGLEALQKEGLIRHWGVSNFDTSDMKELFTVPGGDKCFANEDLYNLNERGTEYDLQDWQKSMV